MITYSKKNRKQMVNKEKCQKKKKKISQLQQML